ncbi:MAG: UDP-N-acetylmuramate dehydrogenase [Proteobacteria bacterium]|nr:UDP-N-acetylmuramate dehydrogenase [Pseudomonadota bacterium]
MLPAYLETEVPLSPRCSLELGGAARFFCEASDEASVLEALRWGRSQTLPVTVLGEGSNVVIADAGIAGVVLKPALAGVQVRLQHDRALLRVQAGEAWDPLVAQSVASGWAGLECLSGIPGSVGATPIQNVGAYGQEVSDTLSSVRVLDRASLNVSDWRAARCDFGYRSSLFRRNPDRYVVLAATFELRRSSLYAPSQGHAELERLLAVRRSRPSLSDVRSAVLELRRSKSMVHDPSDPNRRSVGSFFVNPIVTVSQAETIAGAASDRPDARTPSAMPRFDLPDGRCKLAAAWLIEAAGFRKGQRHGNVGISSRHALALVHHGGGSSRELVALARAIRGAVQQRFGVTLEPEPVLLGFETPPL